MGKHFTEYVKEEIERLNREGLSHRGIGERLGYSRMQIKEYFHRLHKKERAVNPAPQKSKGRPRKTRLTPQQAQELRIKELEREVEMLRSFLRAAGRM